MKKEVTLSLALLAILATLNTSCSKDKGEEETTETINTPLPEEQVEEALAVVADTATYQQGIIALDSKQQEQANNTSKFAFKMFKELTTNSEFKEKDLIFSPICMTYSMSMLNNGAAGETQAEIQRLMEYGDATPTEVNVFCRHVLKSTPLADPEVTLEQANAMYLNDDFTLREQFADCLTSYYDADVRTMRLFSDEAVDHINNWAKEKSHGMIPMLYNDKNDLAATRFVLLSAVYFNGTWAKKFDKGKTVKRQWFRKLTGERKEVNVMSLEDRQLDYAENADYQAVRLPYSNGNFCMTVILPKRLLLDDAIAALDADNWNTLQQQLAPNMVVVKMPGLTIESHIEENDIFKHLGANRMFSPNEAAFPYISPQPIYIDNVWQRAKIEVDEEGTTAAAINVGEVAATGKPSSEPDPWKYFMADHPFIYVISERTSGIIFFMGTYFGVEK